MVYVHMWFVFHGPYYSLYPTPYSRSQALVQSNLLCWTELGSNTENS